MDNIKKKKSRKQAKLKKKNSCLRYVLSCVFENDDTEDSDSNIDDAVKIPSKTNINDEKTKASHAQNENSSSRTTDPYSLSQTPLEKTNNLTLQNVKNNVEEITESLNQQPESLFRKSLFTTTNAQVNSENKNNLTDQLVRTILCKYLAMKSSQQSNISVEEKPFVTHKTMPVEKTLKDDSLHIEYFDKFETSSDSNTNQKDKAISVKPLVECEAKGTSTDDKLYSISNSYIASADDKELTKLKGDFPAKTKSAPTNSTAHDSLADICGKYSHFNQQEIYSDCCESCTEEKLNCKKKLELIFDKSSEEIVTNYEDGSALSLDYKISCENTPVCAGSHRQDSVLHKYERNHEHLREIRRKTITSQELRIQPSAMGEFNGYTDSTTSLKWKLIISHHKDLN